jgi:hypothetical protein
MVVRVPAELPEVQAILYGCLGGVIAYVAIFALPELKSGQFSKDNFVLNRRVVIRLVAIFVFYVGLGGFAAWWAGDAIVAKQAMAYGIGGETVAIGLIKTAGA